MKNKVSIKNIFNQSLSHLRKNWKKAFVSSLLQFGVFLTVFLLTNSVFVSSVSWLVFLPTQYCYLANMSSTNAKLEQVFKLSKNWISYVLLALITAILYICGFVLAILPAMFMFVNFAFVCSFIKDNDLYTSFKKSHDLAKGYRGKLFFVAFIYLFIFLVLVAFSVLIAMLIGLWLNTNHYMLYVWGVFVGVCLYLIFVSPVQCLTINSFKTEIETKNQNVQEDINEQNHLLTETQTLQQNNNQHDSDKIIANNNLQDDDTDLTNFIV